MPYQEFNRTSTTNPAALSRAIPGMEELTRSATSNIGNLLKGLPSADIARTANAYFGIQSGMPGSEFVRNRGFDLYGQMGEERRGRGLNDYVSLINALAPTALQEESLSQGFALDRDRLGLQREQLGEQRRQFDVNQAYQRWLSGEQLGLGRGRLGVDAASAAANTGLNALNSYLSFLS